MKGVFFVAIACLLWALDTLIRYPLLGEGISAQRIVFTEHLLLTIIFIPVLFKSRRKILKAQVSHIGYFFIIGGLGSAIGSLAFTKAFGMINPSLVILLQKLQPLVAIALARVFLGEKIKGKFLWWGSLCLIGGLLISYKDILPGVQNFDLTQGRFDQKSLIGYGLALVAVFCWGSSTVFGKKLSSSNYSEQEIMGGRFFMALLVLLPLSIGSISFDLDSSVWLKIMGMVIFSGVAGMFFYYKGLRKLSARSCALAEMLFPFCAITVNWVFLEATLDLIQIIGGGALILGSTIIQIKRY